jgi:5-methylcytosine-specific restriction endonuclease McrBC GTP-binding regulatory subunit McrB
MDLALRKAQEDFTESYLLTEGLKLERELNVANERIKRLEDSIEKLKDAGDLVFIWLLYNRSHIGGLDVDSALREWKQSKKEAKP